jgi:hypothetical protein
MLDTINFKIYHASVEETESVFDSLREIDSKFYYNDNYFKGTLKGLAITKNQGGTISVSGSLSAYYYGNNFKTLNYYETTKALSNLEVDLGISLDEAKLVRLDISSVVVTEHEPNAYFDSLISYPYKRRHTENNGMYFIGTSEKILIYDKGKKSKIKDGNEYFRYEHRLLSNKRIRNKLMIESVIELKSKEIFNRLADFWYDSYISIHKVEKVYDRSRIDSVSKLKRFIYALGVDSLGGVASALNMVNEIRLTGSVDSNIANKCKQAVTNLYTSPVGICNNELVIELNEAFKTEYDRLLVPTEIMADFQS